MTVNTPAVDVAVLMDVLLVPTLIAVTIMTDIEHYIIPGPVL